MFGLYPKKIVFKRYLQAVAHKTEYTLTCTDLIPVEQILKHFPSCFKVLEIKFITEQLNKTPRLFSNISRRVIETIFSQTGCNLNVLTLYIYIFP